MNPTQCYLSLHGDMQQRARIVEDAFRIFRKRHIDVVCDNAECTKLDIITHLGPMHPRDLGDKLSLSELKSVQMHCVWVNVNNSEFEAYGTWSVVDADITRQTHHLRAGDFENYKPSGHYKAFLMQHGLYDDAHEIS